MEVQDAMSMKDLVEKIWSGSASLDAWTKAVAGGYCDEITSEVAAISTSYFFGNVTAIKTCVGLVLVDTGSRETSEQTFAAIRKWSTDPVHTIIYTHGHIDHVCGVRLYDEEAEAAGRSKPDVVAHRNVLNRFERYDSTQPLNSYIMGKQFNNPGYQFPEGFRRPNYVYDGEYTLTVGGVEFVLMHGQGETDDATFVWLPQQSILVCGDFCIWALPNAGNPRKVQRYAPHWAATLRKMIKLQPAVLLPGHGPAVTGFERVSQILGDAATAMEHLVGETVRLMNQGAGLNEIIHTVRAPAVLLAKPYLLPVYDDPEFIVRGIWHLYAGWYDANPAHLKPSTDIEFAGEIVDAVGGVDQLVKRAEAAVSSGKLRLAAHLIELARTVSPQDVSVHATRAAVYGKIAQCETSLIGKALFSIPARESANFGEGKI